MKETELLHRQVWTRFVRMPYGHILDYADGNGNTVFPTSEEMTACMPNVFGWMTPVENGAFFGGLYLYGLCTAYALHPTEALRGEIKIIADGLLLLCDVGKQDGFIARGLSDDGNTHYPFSSEDQLGPWVLGLWKLRQSPAADGDMRDKIDKRLYRTLHGLRRNGYDVPTEWQDVSRGSYAHDDWRGASKALFCAYVLGQIDGTYREEYGAMCDGHPDGSLFSRVEIASHGFAADMVKNTGLIQFWIDVCAHLCLTELADIDETHRKAYLQGTFDNGVVCEKFLGDWRAYDNQTKPAFEMNWRKLLPQMRPWNTPEEAVAEANRHCGLFAAICPARPKEHSLLANMLFAAWICITSGQREVAVRGAEQLLSAVRHVDWNAMGCSYAFAAEAALYSAKALNVLKEE